MIPEMLQPTVFSRPSTLISIQGIAFATCQREGVVNYFVKKSG